MPLPSSSVPSTSLSFPPGPPSSISPPSPSFTPFSSRLSPPLFPRPWHPDPAYFTASLHLTSPTPDHLLTSSLCYLQVREALVSWLNYMTRPRNLGFSSLRFDFVRGYSPKYVKEYVDATVSPVPLGPSLFPWSLPTSSLPFPLPSPSPSSSSLPLPLYLASPLPLPPLPLDRCSSIAIFRPSFPCPSLSASLLSRPSFRLLTCCSIP